ncbi:hypothetical protein PGSY75_1330500 [Plasmodium gaboni]|uniref:CTLH domain-containing protein n=1 Tax=Plasmodium gaboni TaxID=647221 RepID=A0A151LDT8_9APIC|nr:hypothetical protein PGSY75_1330500 [Plasmodium gaboni]KYN97101.1 hypothetical protein PGSY75_1330500 [Plasmodium gaboni]
MEGDKATSNEKSEDIKKYINEKDELINFDEHNLNNKNENNTNNKPSEETVEKNCCHINNRQCYHIENNQCCAEKILHNYEQNEKDLNKSEEKNKSQEIFNKDNDSEDEELIDMWINLNYTSVDNINICEKVDDLNINEKEKENDKSKMERLRKRQIIENDQKKENDEIETNEEVDIKEDDSNYSSVEDIIISNKDEGNVSSDCTQKGLDVSCKDDKKSIKNNNKKKKKKKNKKEKKKKDMKSLLCLNSLDKSFIQVPLNCILNTFRNIQKEIEKNFMIITLFIEKKLKNLGDDVCIEKLNTMLEKLQVLKRKVNESKMLLNKYIRRLVNRLKYIYFEGDIQVQNLKYDFRFQNYEKRINWLINEYLCTYGYFDTVSIFCKRYNLEDYSDKDVYKEYIYIINELIKHNTQPALDFCQKYKSQLKKIDSNMESELHLQYVIQLIFENKYLEAIEYIKKTVSQPHGCIESDLKYIITHIALYSNNNNNNNNNNKMKKLKKFNDNRWKKIINLFKRVYSDISGLSTNPLLELLLKAGISVIKTDHCGKKTSTKCPTCIKELKNTINKLPNIQKTKSFLVCPYTNEVMDENNPPFTTPTGYVFSEKAISLFLKSDEIFECPITNEKYRMDEFSRLFI